AADKSHLLGPITMKKVKPILCVGCTVIDFVTLNRSFPKEDTDGRCLDGHWQRGGNASNVSTVLRLLTADVDFFGMLSKSGGFGVLLEDLSRRGIGIQHCPQTQKDPPFSSVMIVQDTGSRTIVHCNKNFPFVTSEDFEKIDLNLYGWVHFEARHPEETIKMIRAVRKHNKSREEPIVISLDFESTFQSNLQLCSLCDFVVFSKELALKQGWMTAEAACHGLASILQPNCPRIICPWGSTGASYLDVSNKCCKAEAYKAGEVVDTLGAGDSFMAGFIYAIYIKQNCLQGAVEFANRVAGQKIIGFGYDHIVDLQVEENR
ncbi:hypothetical protein KR222_002359, partial [Zaprionus bogoriensis]